MCGLIENTEFINDINKVVIEASSDSDPIRVLKSSLAQLKDKYTNVEEFKEALKEYMEDEDGVYAISNIEDESIANMLINSIDSIFNTNQENLEEEESKIDFLSPNYSEKSLLKQLFLDKYFKFNSSSKIIFLKDFRNRVIYSLFILNTDEGKKLISSLEEINESLQSFRNLLIEDIELILKNYCTNLELVNFKSKLGIDANFAVSEVLERIFNNNTIFPSRLIARLPEFNSLTKSQLILLKGWKAAITLKHFDDLLVLTFKKAISIKNHGEYNLNDPQKYTLNTADKTIQLWRDEEKDMDETEELGSLPVLFLSSLKIYDKSGTVQNETLDFSNVKVAIGQLMKILDVQAGSTFLGNKFINERITNDIVRILHDEYKHIYNGKDVDYLGSLLDEYVKNKTFKQILASAKMHPEVLMPILFRLTLPFIKDGLDINIYSKLFNKQSKTEETIRSLYYELYAPDDLSIFSINTEKTGFVPDRKSIFLYINTLFLNIENKLLLEYLKDEEGQISVVNLSDKAGNTRLKLFLRALETKFDKFNPLSQNINGKEQFLNFTLIDNLLGEIEEMPKGIIIETNNNRIEVYPNLSIKIFDSNNKELSINNAKKMKGFIPLLSEVLDLDFDEAFFNILRSQGGKIGDIISLVSKILYHFLVSKHMITTKSNQYDTTIKSFYELDNVHLKEYPQSAYTNVLPSIISRSDNRGIMTKLSKVRDIIEGYSEINTVQDGERKLVSTLGLSTLIAKFNEIIENYGKAKTSPIKHFSIFDMYEGFELMRDYAESGNNKQAKKFTELEFITASFLYDTYGELKEIDETTQALVDKIGGILRIMGPVVSDKGNLIKLKYSWDSSIKLKYWPILRPDKPTTPIRLRDLTIADLKYIIKEEFGEYYLNLLNYILSLYDILNNKGYLDLALISLKYPPQLKLNYLSSFSDFNLALTNPETGVCDALKVLRKAIYLAQLAGEEIEIIDLVHYIAKNGKLQNNPSLIHLLQIFGKFEGGEQYEDFWNRKENLLFIDFLLTETELLVKEGIVDKKGLAIQAALEANKNWIKGENIAVGKLTWNDKSLLISTKDDFKNWAPYKALLDYYKQYLPSTLNIDSPDVNLQSIFSAVERFNIIRKLSTSESLNLIINSHKKPKNKKIEKLLLEVKDLYVETRLRYNPEIPMEKIELDFLKRLEKEFYLENGELNKEALINYIVKKEILKDLNSLIAPSVDLNSVSYLIPFIDNIEKTTYKLELNPEFIKHNLLDFFLSEEFVLATTGSYIALPGKSSNILEREAEQFGNAVKRYVSYTASKHREAANTLNGIPEDINIAIIEDDIDFSYNYLGEKGKDKPFDGASFYNIIMNYLSNNSLGGDAMGVDKKSFAHYLGTKSGIGFILKNAGYALTNDRIRNSKFDARLNKHMLDVKWDSPIVKKLLNGEILDWTKDYFGNPINYGEWFAYRLGENGTWSWKQYRVNNGTLEERSVTSTGKAVNDWVPYNTPINSNYDLWEAFGGAYSGHLLTNSDGTETLIYEHDEGSIHRLIQAVNNVGIRKKIYNLEKSQTTGTPVFDQVEKVFDLDSVNLVLKKACIHIIATGGAVKYGGANINPKEAFFDDTYPLTYMTIKGYDLGELLNAEHSAENGEVSLMTLVMNALGARGYTSLETYQCYKALANIAEYITGDVLKAMKTDDPNLIDKVMEKSIYKTLLSALDTDSDMLYALASSLLSGKDPSSQNLAEITKDFPISHPAIFNKILASLAALLEKGIRLTFKGGMYVLNPSNRRMTLINGHLSGYYDSHYKELLTLEEINKTKILSSGADIRLGYNYRNLDTGELFIVKEPTDIYKLQNLIRNGERFYETVLDDNKLALGRDLATYLLSFSDKDGNRYNSWELDSVKMLLYLQIDSKGNEIGFKIPSRDTENDRIAFMANLQKEWDTLTPLLKAFNIYLNKKLLQLKIVDYDLLSFLNLLLAEEINTLSLPTEVLEVGIKNYLTRKFLEELNAISEIGLETEVQINGQKIKVDKTKVEIIPFEMILPLIYREEFGLKDLDSISEIEKDENFFIRRQLDNWQSKIKNEDLYDLELKTINGNHIYLGLLSDDFIPDYLTLSKVDLDFPTNFEWDGEILYRITPLGKRLYSVPYITTETGLIIPDIQVYKDKASDTEIIYSRNLTHFLNEFNYSHLVFSNNEESDKIKLLQLINESTNKVASKKLEIILQLVSARINNKNLKLEDSNNINNLLSAIFEKNEGGETYSLEELIQFDSDKLLQFLSKDSAYIKMQINKLRDDLKFYSGDELLKRNKFFADLILSGIEIRTSFIESLETIVSRTPAQCLLSFMTSKIAAFGLENTNSAYVSRDLLWLQGSDYDIDKISLLGLIFNKGKLITWSPFFNLKNLETFNASKKLPFPTNKLLKTIKTLSSLENSILKILEEKLELNQELTPEENTEYLELLPRKITKIPYNVLRNDLRVLESENSLQIRTQSDNGLDIKYLSNGKIALVISVNWELTSALEKYVLIHRVAEALKDFTGKIVLSNFDIPLSTRLAIGLSGDGKLTGNINIDLDYDEFNHAILGDYFNFNSISKIKTNIIEIAPNLSILIEAYNDLGIIPESSGHFIKELVDYHNTSIKGKSLLDALYNFISIKAKDISKDPINRIQAQAPIDPEMEKIKVLIDDAKKYPNFLKLSGFIKKFDRGSIYSKIKMLTLTLGGKEGVGIEASSLKNFEISSLYNYVTLDTGTVEDQEDLLFNIKINGKTYYILANSRARNSDTIKSQKVKEVLKNLDLYLDTYLKKSGLLSLSTDNAKDPKLPQLNCGQRMLSLYDAGVMLGISIEELAKLILSDTGILLNKIMESNIFIGKQETSRVIDAIRGLQRPPQINLTATQLDTLAPLFKKLGILKENEILTKVRLGKILLHKFLRSQLKEIFNLSTVNSASKFNKTRIVYNILGTLYGSKEYKGFSLRAENYFNELENLENRSQQQEKDYKELGEKRSKKDQVLKEIKLWEDYLNDRPIGNSDIAKEIKEFDQTINNYQKEDFISDLQRIKANAFSDKFFITNIKSIYNWLTLLDIVEEIIVDEEGQKHRILYLLLKLAEIAEEQSVLRPLMKLNLGLESKVEDFTKFYTDFSKIISSRIEILGKTKALSIKNTLELLTKLSEFNLELRNKNRIYSDDPYYIDLHSFLYNKEYNKLIKEIYGNIKCTTNIFKVVDSTPNYRKYLRLADALVQEPLYKSLHYRMFKLIEDTIIFNTTKRLKWQELMRKNTTSYINRLKNTEFLISQNINLKIPNFIIENGKLVYLSGKPNTIQVGLNKENDQKFKEYVEFILYPYLKSKYKGNKFLSYLGYRKYDYNEDHNSSTNLAKIKTNNMDNPSDVALFNLAKLDLLELDTKYITYLFYYNLIAYNNLAGLSSLTSLFVDIIKNNSIQAVTEYNKFIANWDKTNKVIDRKKYIEIMKAIAPVIKLSEVTPHLELKYFYILNPEDKKFYLCYKTSTNVDLEGDEDFDIHSFTGKILSSGYGIFGLSKPLIKGQKVNLLQLGKYKISLTSQLEDILILDGDNYYSIDEILDIAKNKNISTEDCKAFSNTLISLLKGESAAKISKDIEYKLDTILLDDTTC